MPSNRVGCAQANPVHMGSQVPTTLCGPAVKLHNITTQFSCFKDRMYQHSLHSRCIRTLQTLFYATDAFL